MSLSQSPEDQSSHCVARSVEAFLPFALASIYRIKVLPFAVTEECYNTGLGIQSYKDVDFRDNIGHGDGKS
jgi:hypothetical protein